MSGVHVVILAAGKGSRLGALGARTPKWLLPVGAGTIADRHLEAIAQAGTAVASVQVVTGHADGAIRDFLGHDGPVGVVHNPRYADLNNWYSALLALRALDTGEAPVAILNADLFASAAWIAEFLRAAATAREGALIAVDRERELTDESMKVAVDPADDLRLSRIGKVGVAEPIGEYVGMLMASGGELTAFRTALEAFEGEDDHTDEWYEAGVGSSAAGGTRWTVWGTPDSRWVEIDDDADHALAVRLDGAS